MNKAKIVAKRVISLKGSDRIENFIRQDYARDFLIFDAFDGRENGIPDEVDFEKFTTRIQRKPSFGEIGCSMSHYILCKEFSASGADHNKLLLVAEDDARFHAKTEKIINRIVASNDWEKNGLVILSSAGLEAGERDLMSIPQKIASLSLFVKILGWSGRYPFILGSHDGEPLGTGLYLISQNAASKYASLVQQEKISWVADNYESWAKNSGIKTQLLRPGLASWEGESSIGGPGHEWEKYRNMQPKSIKNILAVRIRIDRFKRSLKLATTEIFEKKEQIKNNLFRG